MKVMYSARALAVSIALVLFNVSAHGQPVGAGAAPKAPLSREDIAAAVDANWSRIEDLTVSFSYKTVGDAAPNIVSTDQMKAVIKGGKTYWYRVYASAGQRTEGNVFQREVAFNGEVTTIHEVARAKGMIVPGQEVETRSNTVPFLGTMMYRPRQQKTERGMVDIGDLVSILNCGNVQIRPMLGEVSGHWCYVADYFPSKDFKLMTLWIDPDRGYLPTKTQFYKPDANGPFVMVESVVEDAAEVMQGVWVPTRAQVFKRNSNVEKWDTHYELIVNRLNDGKPDVGINTGVKEDFFDLWKRLPAGTQVLDGRSKLSYTVGGEKYKEMAKALETVPEFESLPVPERSGQTQGAGTAPEGPSPAQPSAPVTVKPHSLLTIVIVGVVVVAAIAVAIVLAGRRRRSTEER